MTATKTRYDGVAMLLHWLIAALIFYNIWLAWQAEDLPRAERVAVLATHRAIGMTVLFLSLFRLAWRFISPPPPLSPELKPLERLGARVVHIGFYVLMIGLPLTGWVMSSASPRLRPIDMFGLFDIPQISALQTMAEPGRRGVHEAFEVLHAGVLKLVAYLLIILHVAGALKHQFIDRDNQLGRIIPFLGRPRTGA